MLDKRGMMEKLKNKKVLIAIIGIILTVCLIVAKVELHAKHNLEEYNKYCLENCELTKVSDDELASIEDVRYSKAVDNIEFDLNNIKGYKGYIDDNKLTADEQSDLDAIKLDKEYNEDATYSIEEIVAMETNYDKVKEATYQVKREVYQRVHNDTINGYLKDINKTKKEIAKYDLSSSEQKKLNGLNKEVTNSDYDTSKKYDVAVMEEKTKQYKTWKHDYDSLLSTIKSRISTEEMNASFQPADETTPVDYNTSNNDYSSNNTSNNSSSNNNTKKASASTNSSSSNNNNDACYDAQGRYNSACATYEYNGNANELPDNICPYKSEQEAIAYADAHVDEHGGYATLPCSKGTWEISWF